MLLIKLKQLVDPPSKKCKRLRMSNIFAILCLFSHQHRVRRKNQPRLKSNKERIQKISAKRTRSIEDLENRFGQHIWSAAPSLFQLYRNMD